MMSIKRKLFGAIIALNAIFVGPVNASDGPLDAVLSRLDKLEKENSVLRERVRSLEASDKSSLSKTARAANPTALGAIVPPLGANANNARAAAAATTLGVGAAAAADLPARTALAQVSSPTPVFSWTGFYVGVNAGYGWGNDPFSNPVATGLTLSGVNSHGYVFGGHAGYNWQYGTFVGGLEIDMSATGVKGSTGGGPTAPDGYGYRYSATQTDRFNYLGTARARVGFLPWENLLLYGTGGLGWTRVTTDFNSTYTYGNYTDARTSSTPANLFGWVVGVGAEASLASVGMATLLARVEYLHFDFGSQASSSYSQSGGGGNPYASASTSGRLTADVVRTGLSLKF